jgi:hypothetical protein
MVKKCAICKHNVQSYFGQLCVDCCINNMCTIRADSITRTIGLFKYDMKHQCNIKWGKIFRYGEKYFLIDDLISLAKRKNGNHVKKMAKLDKFIKLHTERLVNKKIVDEKSSKIFERLEQISDKFEDENIIIYLHSSEFYKIMTDLVTNFSDDWDNERIINHLTEKLQAKKTIELSVSPRIRN